MQGGWEEGAFPLVDFGNCCSIVGIIAESQVAETLAGYEAVRLWGSRNLFIYFPRSRARLEK